MPPTKATTGAAPRHDVKVITALRRFAISISVLNIAGYTFLGFEQPWLWPFVAVLTAYVVEIGLEVVSARGEGRAPRFAGGGLKGMVEFLFPAHITGLAVNMLTYVNDRVWVLVFGVIVAVGTKWVLRAPVKGRMRHFMNPSNFGITVILLLFPWASIAPPYHFTEYLYGPADWVLPAIILVLGTLLNAKLTGRMWLIGAWLAGFVLQAVIRGLVTGTSIPAALGMMTGVAFVLFTNYMVTDPGTSPSKRSSQIAFGAGVAAMYGVLTGLGIAYGIFFATALVCLIRGGYLWGLHFLAKQRAAADRQASQPPARQAPAPQAPAQQVPAQQVPAQQVPAQQVPAQQVPAQQVPARQVPARPVGQGAAVPAPGAFPAPNVAPAGAAESGAVSTGDPCRDGTCLHGTCASLRAAALEKKVAVAE